LLVQRDQHLHHSGLKRLTTIRPVRLGRRRRNGDAPKPKIRLPREVDEPERGDDIQWPACPVSRGMPDGSAATQRSGPVRMRPHSPFLRPPEVISGSAGRRQSALGGEKSARGRRKIGVAQLPPRGPIRKLGRGFSQLGNQE
jgi:hypothetical protein